MQDRNKEHNKRKKYEYITEIGNRVYITGKDTGQEEGARIQGRKKEQGYRTGRRNKDAGQGGRN